ncbi:MAG: ribose 5-phosphate isomerase B [Aureliella sp.]
MRITIGSDHRGLQVKKKCIRCLTELGHDVVDVGTDEEASVDYPDFAKVVCEQVASGQSQRGILICGTGIGMVITANKFKGVRAANCADEVTAEICRRHNDVNVLCLPGDFLGDRPVDDLINVWLDTEFDGGRHQRRIEKINALEDSID